MDRYMLFPSGMGQHPNGSHALYADAQATMAALQAKLEDLTAKYQNLVAWYDKQNGTPCEQVRHRQEVEALQARVQELEDGTTALLNQQSERLSVENEKLMMALSQLIQRTAERDTARRRVDELEAREVDVVLLREDLEKRTAELEAAKADRVPNSMSHVIELQAMNNRLGVRVETLEAQLTQRTAELETIEKILDIDSGKTTVEKVRDLHHSFEQVWESYQDASNEMFKAQAELERVRGERDRWQSKYDVAQMNAKNWQDKYEYLLQHRQGMEG